jgi:cysteinyl-tRNA synthetase
MHNGFVNVNQEKMSKSIGNVLLVRDLLEHASGEAIRYVLLSTHYRAPLDWTDEALQQANNSLDRFYGALRKMSSIEVPDDIGDQKPQGFVDAMLDDLNVPKAMAELFVLAKKANTSDANVELVKIKAALLQSGEWLGLFQQDPEDWFSSGGDNIDAEQIDALIAERSKAQADKNWARADQIRDILAEKKIIVEDGASGTSWRVEK